MSANQAEQAAACRMFRLLLPSLFQLYNHSYQKLHRENKEKFPYLNPLIFTENAAAFFLFVFR